MKQRLKTSIYIILVTVLAILSKLLPLDIGTYLFDIFIVSIAIVAGFEMINIMDKMNKNINKFLIYIYPLVYYITLLICLNSGVSFPVITLIEFLIVALYFVVTVIVELIKNKTKDIHKLALTGVNTVVACMYPGFWFCLFLNINHIDIFIGKYLSFILIILIVAITMLTDTFAYLVGSKLRGPKLAPSISPNKTISGAVGGLIGGMAGAMILYWVVTLIPALNSVIEMQGIVWWHFLIVGLIGSVLGQIGDLFESKIKRVANIKDSGNIFPGHGGMLDRIDAMIFVIIFVFIFISLIMI